MSKLYKHIINFILMLCFLIVPMIFWMRHFHSFIAMKQFVFAFSVILSSGLLLIASIRRQTLLIRQSRLTFAVTLYYLYNLFSCLLFPYTDRTFLFFFSCCVLLFFIVSSVTDSRSRNRILYTLSLVALVSSIYGCFQFFGKVPYQNFHRYFGPLKLGSFEGMRIFSTFGHPNLLGGFCVGILPIIAALLLKNLREKQYGISAFLFVTFILSLLSLLLSRTRGAWLAVICSFSVFAAILFGKRLLSVVLKRKLVLGSILVVLIAGAIGLFALIKEHTSLADSTSFNIRLEYYKHTLNMIAEHPLFGRGFGTFNVYYPLYRNERTAIRLGEMSGAYRVEHPHNEHLEILHDGGVIGYLLFLWIMIEAMVSLIQRKDIIDVGIAMALLGLLCDGLLSQNLRVMVIASVFWLLIGFANRAEFLYEQYQSRSIFKLNAPQLLGIISVLVLMGGTIWFVYNLMQADAYVKDGMGYCSSKQYQHAINQFAEALSRDSRNKRALYYSASAYRLMDKTDLAMRQYAQLFELDPNFLQTNFFLGALYIQKRDVENALHSFERQIAGNNMHWKAYYNLAILEFQQKNWDKGIRYLKEIETIHAIHPIDAEIFQKVRTMLAQHATLTTSRRW